MMFVGWSWLVLGCVYYSVIFFVCFFVVIMEFINIVFDIDYIVSLDFLV